jgi:hypothetical protein
MGDPFASFSTSSVEPTARSVDMSFEFVVGFMNCASISEKRYIASVDLDNLVKSQKSKLFTNSSTLTNRLFLQDIQVPYYINAPLLFQ